MNKNKKKMLLLIPIIVLVCAFPNVSARFLHQGNTSNGARVASFNIKDEGTWTDYIAVNISPGEDIEARTIKLKNASEVAVDYTITIKKETNNIGNLETLIKDSNGTAIECTSKSDNTWTFTDRLDPNQSEAEYQVMLNWQATGINEVDTNLNDIGKVDYFTVTITATQAD
jgi:hypothetical protein